MEQQLNNENPTQEEALAHVNSVLFPEAILGESVKQFGYWFVLTETGWVIPTDQ